ncbi:MAG TPA: pepsin/retropepsin-like aspartic protease family protein [Pyrinomonadaceae bacterium]|nr:pepsin/retropepsin-like aspartic protease family protein [Pyrinomonadaceae bacterium]
MGGKLSIAFSALAIMMGAVLSLGAAPIVSPIVSPIISHYSINRANSVSARQPGRSTSTAARFHLDRGLGLLVQTWINGAGPYVFAIDTGAGLNLISERVVREARLPVNNTKPTLLGGLTGARGSTNRAALIQQMALGNSSNILPSKQVALVVPLPAALDGILDPNVAYAPNGYTIDFPNEMIQAFEGSLQGREPPAGGAIVSWVRRAGSSRPYVKLQDGRTALVDTGSGFGLAVSGRDAVIVGGSDRQNAVVARDIGGGSISSRRVAPTTVSIGQLELRGVPTDILFGVEANAPVILGRDALRPFKITFDPRRRLIEFEPPA